MTTRSHSLRVLLDGRLTQRGLGISSYVSRLAEGMNEHPTVELTVWGANSMEGALEWKTLLSHSGLFDLSPRADSRSRKFDVVHFASNICSIFPGRRSVLTLHDLFARDRNRFRDRVYGFLLDRGLREVNQIVAVSARSADEALRVLPQIGKHITVIPTGFRNVKPMSGPRDHLIAFGGSDPRKRTDLMIEVYGRYRRTARDPLPLVVMARAGLTDGQETALRELGALVVSDASRSEVDRLIAGAAALIYTSTREGFGLPILEAAELSTPVVVDEDAEIAREVIGQHCFQVKGTEPDEWVRKLEVAIASGPVSNDLQLPSLGAMAASYIEVYRQVLA
jgi:glycosyltransferase involved in cell wall biosynthesis